MNDRGASRQASSPAASPRRPSSAPRSRPASRTSSSSSSAPLPPPSRSPSPSPCAALTWDGPLEKNRCAHKRPLPTPAALRAFLAGLAPGDAKSMALATATATATATKAAVEDKPLLLLRGLAPAFLRVLLDAPLGIEPGFVEAHAARRRYRPRPGRREEEAAQWNYPELVGGLAQAVWQGKGGSLPIMDGLGRAAVRAVSSEREDLAAVECRASVWVAERVDVLFLDMPVWEEPGSLLRKARRRTVVPLVEGWVDETTGAKGWGASAAVDEEIPSFEDALHETRAASAFPEGSRLVDILEATAYDKWLDFFEVLAPRQAPLIVDGTSLEWRALQALEGNLNMATTVTQRRQRSATMESTLDWSALLQRLRDRTALLATIIASGPALTSPPPPPPPPPPSPRPATRNSRRPSVHQDNFTNLPVPRRRPRLPPLPPPPSVPASSDENQRALDRVTYLGGILLPISLVSSVLSMNEDFEPGQPLFWVFWAAAVPLTLLTFVIIYADKLRSAEVWVEIGSLGVAGSPSSSSVHQMQPVDYRLSPTRRKRRKTTGRTHDEEEELSPKREKWGPEARDKKAKLPPPPPRRPAVRPQVMAYAGEEVVIDLSEAVAQAQPIVWEPRTSPHKPDNNNINNDDDDDDNGNHHRPSSERPDHQQQQQQQPAQPSSSDASEDDDDDEEEEEEEDGYEDEDEDMDPNMYITRPTDGTRPHAWRKKQLGWGGAAMCILRMQKPQRVDDGLPVARGARRDVEKRLKQARRRASVEGRRSLSY